MYIIYFELCMLYDYVIKGNVENKKNITKVQHF